MNMLSNLFPKILFEGKSGHSDNIKVIQIGKTKKLIVNGIVQSLSGNSNFARGKVWGKVVDVIVKNKPNTKQILLLGMGTGTMLHMLNEKLNHVESTSVEIDKKIVGLAYEHFELDALLNNKVIIADAVEVVMKPANYGITGKFDCIILDTYVGGKLPKSISDEQFFSKMLELAKTNALIVINKIVYKENPQEITEFSDFLGKYLKKPRFEVVKYKAVADNYVFFGKPNPQ